MIRTVLVPTDFTEESELLVRFASGLASLGVRQATLAHSVEASGMEGPVIVASVDRARDRLQQVASALGGGGLDVEIRVVTGRAADAMVALASEIHVDAIVSGTHGKTVVDRLMGGSISEDLLAAADRPNLFCRFQLLRNAAEPADIARAMARALVLPTDFSASATRAFDVATGLERGAVGVLYLLHVVDATLDGEAQRKAREGAEFQLGNMVDVAEERGVTARSVIRQGDPIREILHELDERRASGVVTGSRGRGGAWTEAVLGSVSLTLLRQASVPVLVVP